MAHAAQPQTPGSAGAPGQPDPLRLLAAALHRQARLAVRIRADDDGFPVLDVAGPASRAAVMAGSVHYWWADGTGPIAPVSDPGRAADRVAARCASPAATQARPNGRPDPPAAPPEPA
jgi:hypothetical protein